MKTIDFNKTVFALSKEHPDIIRIMKELGFSDISSANMIQTAGRFMTIPKGAKMKKISLEKVIEEFEKQGYQVEGIEKNE